MFQSMGKNTNVITNLRSKILICSCDTLGRHPQILARIFMYVPTLCVHAANAMVRLQSIKSVQKTQQTALV